MPSVTLNFPAQASYTFEVDYLGCCAESLVLTMALTTGEHPCRSGAGRTHRVDAGRDRIVSGARFAKRPVTLVVGGGHPPQEMTAITNASGVATFGYTGARACGKDTLQTRAHTSGGVAYSDAVDISWNNGVNAAPTVHVRIAKVGARM